MRIGEVSESLGISAATLRMWERQGLVRPSRSAGGVRDYTEQDLAILTRVRYLRQAERLSPRAIARLLGAAIVIPPGEQASRSDGSNLGPRLRAQRRVAGYTLKQVADKTGLSVSFLSAVEREATGLSIATLQKLTSVYRITVLGLLGSRPDSQRVVRRSDRHGFLDSGSGVKIEQLALGILQMEPQLFTIQPGAGSEGAYHHAGEEFIFTLRGIFEIWLDEVEHYVLEPGDSLYFPSTISHRWRNPGAEETELVWVNTPPTF